MVIERSLWGYVTILFTHGFVWIQIFLIWCTLTCIHHLGCHCPTQKLFASTILFYLFCPILTIVRSTVSSTDSLTLSGHFPRYGREKGGGKHSSIVWPTLVRNIVKFWVFIFYTYITFYIFILKLIKVCWLK